MAHYLCKLVAPRPGFPHDMTQAEADLMGEHAAYWSGLVASGSAVIFGPVFDPAGVWGMAVAEVDSEADARALTDRDPVVLAGSGFVDEIHVMPNAVARQRDGSPRS